MAALASAVLAACGGGGDGSSGSTSNTGSGGSNPPAPTVVTTSISGTAATGAALAGATVEAKCATGGGSATTAADGTFTIKIDNATRPCVLSVTSGGTTLHSVVEAGTGTSVVANVTPLTELVTAALAQGDTTAFFTNFDKTAQDKLTNTALASANSQVSLSLSGVVNLGSVDPVKDALVAANGGKPGNALDQLLDQLAARLGTSKATLKDLATALASNAGTSAIKTVLQTASDSCASLRSDAYYYLGGRLAPTPASVDAKLMTLAVGGGPAVSLAPVTLDACHLQGIAQVSLQSSLQSSVQVSPVVFEMFVSKSGIALLVPPASSNQVVPPTLLVPAQAIALSELAGDWNALSYVGVNGVQTPGRSTFSINAGGQVTAYSECNGLTCTAVPASMTVTANAAEGGFDINGGASTQRAIVFKGTDGVYTAVIASQEGLAIATKVIARTLPALNSVSSYWDATYLATSIVQETWSTQIIGVDTANGTYTRKRADGRIDTWTLNKPLTGLRYRPAGTNVYEGIALPLGNTGVSAMISMGAAPPYFDVSVSRP